MKLKYTKEDAVVKYHGCFLEEKIDFSSLHTLLPAI